MTKTSHYTRLPIWERATRLVREVYRLSAAFPNADRNGLSANLQQDVLAIPSSIADCQSAAAASEKI